MSSPSFFNKKKDLNLWPITLLRVYTGVFFAYHGFGKIRGGGFADGLAGFVGSQENSYGFFRPFLDSGFCCVAEQSAVWLYGLLG